MGDRAQPGCIPRGCDRLRFSPVGLAVPRDIRASLPFATLLFLMISSLMFASHALLVSCVGTDRKSRPDLTCFINLLKTLPAHSATLHPMSCTVRSLIASWHVAPYLLLIWHFDEDDNKQTSRGARRSL